jgi:hypothetical protein
MERDFISVFLLYSALFHRRDERIFSPSAKYHFPTFRRAPVMSGDCGPVMQ